MKKNISKLLFAFGLVAFCSQGYAQEKPAPVPNNLEKIEEVPDSGITISKPEDKKKATEKRVDGKVTEVQVGTGKTSYTVKANPEVGNAVPGTQAGNANRAAEFTLFKFGGPKENKEAEEPAALAPAPNATSSAASSTDKK